MTNIMATISVNITVLNTKLTQFVSKADLKAFCLKPLHQKRKIIKKLCLFLNYEKKKNEQKIIYYIFISALVTNR